MPDAVKVDERLKEALSDAMLHGGGGARDQWTWGCVALDNDAMDELFELLPLGTAVKVLPVEKDE